VLLRVQLARCVSLCYVMRDCLGACHVVWECAVESAAG